MQRYSATFVDKARQLSQKGLTYRKIAQILKVDNSNVSVWCRNEAKTNPRNIINKLEKNRYLIKNSENYVLETINFNKNINKLTCAILYGCEGAKYPASNCVALTNSDPSLIRAFVCLFRRNYQISEKKFRISLQIHSHQNYKKLQNYWSKLLEIPIEQFYKPTITVAGQKKHRTNYLGTCTVKYYDYKIQLKLIGIYEAFMRKSSLLEESHSGPVHEFAKLGPE